MSNKQKVKTKPQMQINYQNLPGQAPLDMCNKMLCPYCGHHGYVVEIHPFAVPQLLQKAVNPQLPPAPNNPIVSNINAQVAYCLQCRRRYAVDAFVVLPKEANNNK